MRAPVGPVVYPPEAPLHIQRPQEDNHSSSATPVLAALGLAGKVGDVKGDGDGVDGDGAWVLAVDGVVLHESARVVKGEGRVVDNHGHDVGDVFEGGVANEAAATIYSNIDSRG